MLSHLQCKLTSFKNKLCTNGNQKRTTDENGIVYIGVIPFLLEKDSIEK